VASRCFGTTARAGSPRSRACYAGYGAGTPYGGVTADFDGDGRPDLAVITSRESLYVLYNDFETPTTAVLPPGGPGAADYQLGAAFRNPAHAHATIRFTMPVAGRVRLTLHDVLGRRVATLVDGPLEAGHHRAVLVIRELANGIYLFRLEAGPFRGMGRLSVVR
jgi:hypothetical protein